MYQNKHEHTTKIQKHDQIYRNVHQCQETRLYSIAIQLWWKVNSSLQIWPDLASISTPFYFHILFSCIHMKNIWRFMNPSQFLLHWNLLSISICDHHGGKNWSFINVQYQYSPIGSPCYTSSGFPFLLRLVKKMWCSLVVIHLIYLHKAKASSNAMQNMARPQICKTSSLMQYAT